MITRKQAVHTVLHRLRLHLGMGEHPPGSNHNNITEWYNRNVAKIGNGPWCQMTDTWSVWTAGFKELLTGTAYTVYAAQNAQKGLNGSSWHYGTKGMRAGDQVYYDWTGAKGPDAIQKIDHTGTVEKILGGGLFYALEGNMGDKLVRVKRDGKFVVGYVRLNWDLVSEKPKPKPHPAPTPTPTHTHETPHHVDPDSAKIKAIQNAVGVKADGQWGDKTDEAVLTFRKKHRNKF